MNYIQYENDFGTNSQTAGLFLGHSNQSAFISAQMTAIDSILTDIDDERSFCN